MANYSSKRGHLALKSNALNPTATSYEGQQLILNHMKSHYSRITKAKAAVDTTAPRSMKKHIRVQDQKQREYLRKKSGIQGEERSTSRRRAQSVSVENLSNEGPWTSSRPNSNQDYYSDYRVISTPLDCSTPNPSSSRPGNVDSAYLKSSKDQPRQCNLREENHEVLSRVTPHGTPRALPGPVFSHSRWKSTPIRNLDKQSSCNCDIDMGARRKPAINEKLKDFEPIANTSNEKESTELEGCAQIERDNTKEKIHPHAELHTQLLDRSTSLFRSPSSSYARRKKEMQTKMWEEEQKYLHFISDVTLDVLGRGIFSNRVLNKVFESHIDRRKDDLDEGQMRTMIDQLKLDLDIE